MPADVAIGRDGREALERAQVVWQRARELVIPANQHDPSAVTLALLRTAHHDATQLAHALTLGRTHLRGHADDAEGRDGVRILERAIVFLGVNPSPFDVGAGRRRR